MHPHDLGELTDERRFALGIAEYKLQLVVCVVSRFARSIALVYGKDDGAPKVAAGKLYEEGEESHEDEAPFCRER